MAYAPLLGQTELASALAGLPHWTREGDAIVRTVRCESFRAVTDLVLDMAYQIERTVS